MEDKKPEVSPTEPIKKSPDLRLTVADILGIDKKYLKVSHQFNDSYRVYILEYEEVLMVQRLMPQRSHFVVWDGEKIISANPPFPTK